MRKSPRFQKNQPAKAFFAPCLGVGWQRGFALVVVLSLMVLLVILSLGMLSIASISLRSTGHGDAQSRAQTNARMALMLALGELQKTAGPDQRVTARAEILDSTPDNTNITDVNQPYWTGVWSTGSAGLDVEPAAPGPQRNTSLGALTPTLAEKSTNAVTWMVSNPTPDSKLDPILWNSDNSTPLARGFGFAAATVSAPLVDLADPANPSQVKGKYAYWVSDEGIKANLGLVPNAASGDPARLARYMSPAALAGEQAVGLNYRSDFPGNDANVLSKLVSPKSLNVVMGEGFRNNSAGWAATQADVTTWSKSVLADVKHGGLKTDLTAAFENVDQFTKLTTDREVPGLVEPEGSRPERHLQSGGGDNVKGHLWRVGTNMALPYEGGRWFPFYSHYNLYKARMPAFRTSPAPTGSAPAGLGGIGGTTLDPRWSWMSDPNVHLGGLSVATLTPTLLAMKAEIGISTYPTGGMVGGEPAYGVRIHYTPSLILWNPYDVTLNETPLLGYTLFTNAYRVAGDDAVIIKRTNTPEQVVFDGNMFPGNFGEWTLRPKRGEGVFAPGEIRIYGLHEEDAGVFPGNHPGLRKDFADGHSLHHDLTLNNPLKADDVIQIAYPSRVRANSFKFAVTRAIGWPDRMESGWEPPSAVLEVRRGFGYSEEQEKKSIFPPRGIPPGSMTGGIPVSDLSGPASTQRVAAFILRAKGRFPEEPNSEHFPDREPLKVPMQGAAGALFNPTHFSESIGVWNLDNRTGTGFSSAEELQNDGNGRSYWGEHDAGVVDPSGLGGGTILRELPREPMISLGQFKNADSFLLYDRDMGVMSSLVAVGNSWQNPQHIALKQDGEGALRRTQPAPWGGPRRAFRIVDDTWLNNDALFDRFFFSTVPPKDLPSNTTLPTEWNGFDQASVDAGDPLLNPRLKFYRGEGKAPDLDEFRQMDTAAAHLMLNGGFNVNSTSVPAWRALLASLRFPSAPSDQHPMPRFISEISSIPDSDDYATGMRVLSDAQIDALAEAVVEQVKLRGPFLTLADFINRRRVSGPMGEMGALQAAIDASGINADAYAALGEATDLSGAPQPPHNINNLSAPPNTAEGAPGVITQADLVQAFAPLITPRSDTFMIRAYGETLDASGKVTAKAWCEAVVQRTPAYLDSADPALAETHPEYDIPLGNATPTEFLNPTNKNFGRRFEIISFRWLTPHEL